jgi:outer membrane lipoprotein SlyB
MKKLILISLLIAITLTGCKKNGYYDTGAIMVDESLISDTFRQGNIYSENNYIAKR